MMNYAPLRNLNLARMAREVLAIRAARRSFTAFKRLVWSAYQHAPHLSLVDSMLQQVVRCVDTNGEEGISHLIVEMPPRHGKSQSISRLFPTWFLGSHPDMRVILSSYGTTLAERHSYYARNVLRSPRYKAIFPDVHLAEDSQAAARWSIYRHDGGMDALGIGGGVTGKGGNILIVDDPVKSREEAESFLIRQKTFDWFNDDFYTRREPGAAVIIVMTRWHEDDLVGRLLLQDPERWSVLRLPAIAEEEDPLGRSPGEALWPERFPLPALEDIKNRIGVYSWNGLYQQRPTAREGFRFKRSWFTIVDATPAIAKRARYWDKGGTEGDGAYTAGVLLALAPDNRVYVEEVIRGQWGATEREAVIRQTAELDAQRYDHTVVTFIEQEPGSGGKESAQATIRNLAGFNVRRDHPVGDKDVRLDPFEAQAGAGNVYLLRGRWNHDYIEELCAIPFGRYRDQADATAGAFNRLTATSTTTRPEARRYA